MSSAKNNIWPAYVDMMTVLLMVYVLISAILGVIIAQVKETEYQEKQRNAEIITESKEKELYNVNSTQNSIKNSNKILNEVEEQYILLSNDLYNDKDSLTIYFVNDDLSLKEGENKKLTEYIKKDTSKHGKYEVAVFLQRNEKVSVGAQLREQSVIYLKLLKIMSEQGVDINSQIENKNVIPSLNYENIIKIKFVETKAK
ncbi:hypothetical protein CDJ04_25605 [Salmonella enterica]|uniref:Uncharacterized protein n=2 Tax=Salmonella enterica TaxID=28901 RepID=A0A403QJ90_SALET|nr:hypothetical protein [Salmonella enterica]EAS0615379.1 hypothetical protein [Salmonella enterica subsp. enterica serovar Dahomey]EBQ9004937.1 hypothetical protein [Salmonella enterica subsp. enterica serovar Blockley]EBS0793152.1 hypothetical protein [Salmonella enterica subsp. enterica serovar Overschie]EBZ5137401.1 hypothetical protein [Salmonella enterica subsp. enterica serovar Antsalova]ECD5540905.1 hypothetical protein [Salmonella enterica subsp. enterica serovar Kokomlemle]ECD615792